MLISDQLQASVCPVNTLKRVNSSTSGTNKIWMKGMFSPQPCLGSDAWKNSWDDLKLSGMMALEPPWLEEKCVFEQRLPGPWRAGDTFRSQCVCPCHMSAWISFNTSLPYLGKPLHEAVLEALIRTGPPPCS